MTKHPDPGKLRIVHAPLSVKNEVLEATFSTWEEHRARQPYAFPGNGFKVSHESFIDFAFHQAEAGERPDSPYVYAAFLGEDLAGYATLNEWGHPDLKVVPSVDIRDVYVKPEFRGRGIAKALITHIKAEAAAQGWDDLRAIIWNGNAGSEALFVASGFVPSAKILRFGPETQARDWPDRDEPPKKRNRDTWFFIAILAVGATLAFLTR